MEPYSSDDIKRKKRRNFDEIGRTPLEDEINQTIDSFEKMVKLFLKLPETINSKIISPQEQIDLLETRFNNLENEVTINQASPITAPHSPTQNPENPRRTLMNELRDLLERRRQR